MNNGSGGFGRRKFVAGSAGLLAGARAALGQQGSYRDSSFTGGPIAGPFRPYWESLKAYRHPDWFRDAKFGMWAHWSPQCVPEQGDWYARGMYIQNGGQYNYHVRTYGHPSQFGHKDICHIWRAENWNPEELIRLYAKTGAKYFVALANHHDNFDCWNSKYQPSELRECRAEKGYRGDLGKGRPRARAQVRHHRSCHSGACVEGVHAGPVRQRPDWSAEGRAIRRRSDESRWQRQVVGGHEPAGS
jgi:hypothetical protein